MLSRLPPSTPNGLCISLVCSFSLLPWRPVGQPRRREVTTCYNSIRLTNTHADNSKTNTQGKNTGCMHTKPQKWVGAYEHARACNMHATCSLWKPTGAIHNEVLLQKGVVLLYRPLNSSKLMYRPCSLDDSLLLYEKHASPQLCVLSRGTRAA